MKKFKEVMKIMLFAIIIFPFAYLLATYVGFKLENIIYKPKKELIKYSKYVYFYGTEAKNTWSDDKLKVVEKALTKEISPKIMNAFNKDGFKVILYPSYNFEDDGEWITTGQTNVMVKQVQIAYSDDNKELRQAVIHEIGHYVDFKCNYSLHLNNTVNKSYYKDNDHYSEYAKSSMSEFVADSFYYSTINSKHTKSINKVINSYINNNFNYKTYGQYGYCLNKVKFAFYDSFISPYKTY